MEVINILLYQVMKFMKLFNILIKKKIVKIKKNKKKKFIIKYINNLKYLLDGLYI